MLCTPNFKRTACVLMLMAAALAGCGSTRAAPVERAEIVASYPHDGGASTQGLIFAGGALYESTGQYGDSTLRRVALDTGDVLARVVLDESYFGEGLARVGDRLIQLTWKAGVGFVYDRETLARVDTVHYVGEGWGLTYDGRQLIMSDGSATLRFLDPETFEVERRLGVTLRGEPLDQLNELEYIDGEIWANVWHSDDIVRIDPDSGRVTGIVKAGHLRERLPTGSTAGVLNGIAWDAAGQRLFVTGKNWPRLFEIRYPPGGG